MLHKYAIKVDSTDKENPILSQYEIYGEGFPDDKPALFNNRIDAKRALDAMIYEFGPSIDLILLEVDERLI